MTYPTAVKKRPSWLRKELPENGVTKELSTYLKDNSIETVCVNSRCPNIGECYSAGNISFLILGNICTRNCSFCAIQKGLPGKVDKKEPAAVAGAVKKLKLKYAVITSVTRDDLPDGGAAHYSEVVRAVKGISPEIAVETLTPDFKGSGRAVDTVIESGVDVFAHNMETVARLHPDIKPLSDYCRSLDILARAASFKNTFVKSGFMVGLGETDEEIGQLLEDIRGTGCSFLTIGQYLRPSNSLLEVQRYLSPANFEGLKKKAVDSGFKKVASGPFIRSSYKAIELFQE
ncbi:MAG: lipoyl synthase [Candidatus Omnitrophota bacterium]|nr:lipoyl synthase [Candidatus Omnitrophota bacterium]